MRVLDATFLIDYLDGVEATKAFYEAHGGENERWVMPVPAYAEALVGEGNLPSGDVDGARGALSWGETYAVDERTAVTAGEIADEVGSSGPYLDGLDALIAAVGRELDAPVVSGDSDLTHPETKHVIDVEEYREPEHDH
ncbi:PilT protein domain protein [Halorhabdus utahensis DSM 12940]|uniref:PilT protein domain protein n=1 Tax=Halorhabdus utahensis (strain DSM 12940 / JCM 11049 / AX-2) TaxID=519442 RepID=C7NM81_HALUD|nr:PIN domain-containing protein [Halorhabdus utahensis]ACV11289.1 PilT protein domain protein [Halorhabdus utahensis DSM 12940]